MKILYFKRNKYVIIFNVRDVAEKDLFKERVTVIFSGQAVFRPSVSGCVVGRWVGAPSITYLEGVCLLYLFLNLCHI